MRGKNRLQVVRIVLVLITIGCILGPIGAVVIMYHNNLVGMVMTPQVKQLLNGNNNNGNNNNNNNNGNNGNNNNNSNNNNNGNNNNNNGNNNNPTSSNPMSSFGGSGQINVTIQENGNQVSDQISETINCVVTQNGNSIQLTLTLEAQSVPSDLQPTFVPNNGYNFNFDGSASPMNSGTQITASSQGGLSPGGPYNINFSGTIDSTQNTLTFTLTSAANAQVIITTPQAISIYNNGNNNNNNGNNSSTPTPSGNNNNNGPNMSLDNAASQIDTSTGQITLVFNVTNTDSQSETISKMSGTAINNNDQTNLGSVKQASSVTIPAGQSAEVKVTGTLTSQGKSDLSGVSSMDIAIENGSMTVNGVSQSGSQTQDLGNISVVS
jgi:hypothetical protein